MKLFHAWIKVAEKAVEERNADFGELMAKKTLDMNKLKIRQAQIAMGVKRKNELQLEACLVEKKIKKAKEKQGIGTPKKMQIRTEVHQKDGNVTHTFKNLEKLS